MLSPLTATPLDVAAIRSQCTKELLTQKEAYQQFKEQGFQYGPTFRVLDELHKGEGEVIGTIKPPPDDSQQFHVTFLDGCLQMTLLTSDNSNTYLPIHIGKIVVSVLYSTCICMVPAHVYAHMTFIYAYMYSPRGMCTLACMT